MRKVIGGLLFGCIAASVFADAPVVDYSSSATSDTVKTFAMSSADSKPIVATAKTSFSKTNFSVEQRINKLEQQVDNINGQSLSSKLEVLQQNLQEINGKLEDEAHQIEQLNKQLKDFYQDLNQRVGTVKPATTSPTANSVPVVANVTTITTAVNQDAVKATGNVVSNSSLVPATASNVAGAFGNQPQLPQQVVAPAVSADSAFLKEQQMYQTAIDLLPEKKHESENKLREYLKQYPKGSYVANAHYWLGDINFLQKNFDAAEEEFKIVVDKYPKSKRVANAKLKLALVHQNQGREAEAKQELQKIVKLYPGTSAAQLAKQQLVAK